MKAKRAPKPLGRRAIAEWPELPRRRTPHGQAALMRLKELRLEETRKGLPITARDN